MTNLINWSERYSVNNAIIDEQHKKLVDLINVLHMAKEERHDAEAVEGILGELKQYVAEHFSYEEKLLSDSAYPGLEQHKKQHLEFSSWLKTALENTADSKHKRELPQHVLNFLKNWLTGHILNSDKKYVTSIYGKK